MLRYLTLLVSFTALSIFILTGCEAERSHVTFAGAVDDQKTKVRVEAIESVKSSRRDFGKGANSGRSETTTTESVLIVDGQIRDFQGKPVAGAQVALNSRPLLHDFMSADRSWVENGKGVSGADGRYEIRVNFETRLAAPELHVKGEGIPQFRIDLSSILPSSPAGVRLRKDITLPEGHLVSGSVVNSAGSALAGLPVRLHPAVSVSTDGRLQEVLFTTTTAAGEFAVEHIPAGRWMIATAHPEFAPLLEEIEVPTSGAITLQVASLGGTVAGRVFDKGSGSPVGDVEVGISDDRETLLLGDLPNYRVRSAEDGTFQFVRVSSVPKSVSVAMEERRLYLARPFPQELRTQEGETTDIVVYVYHGHSVAGRVYDKDSGEPLVGSTVLAIGGAGEKSVQSDDQGHYRIPHVVPRDARLGFVRVTKDGYDLATDKDLTGLRQVPLPDDQLEVKLDLPMTKRVKLRGKVVNDADKPIPHAKVKLVDFRALLNGEPVETDDDGQFELSVRPFSHAIVEARARGFGTTESEPVEVIAGDVEGVVIRMEPGATVMGRVLDERGDPVVGSLVRQRITYNASTRYIDVAVSGPDGSYAIYDVAASISLFPQKRGYAETPPTDLILMGGETRSGVDLILPDGFNIGGRLIDRAGQPVVGASLSMRGDVGRVGHKFAKTAEDGSFIINDVPDGTYSLKLFHPETKSFPNIQAGTTDLELIIDGDTGAVSGDIKFVGTVIDDKTEEPVSDFKVLTGADYRKLDEPGKFEISIPDPSYIEFTVSAPDYLGRDFKSYLPRGEVSESTIRLGKGGMIVGRVVDRQSKQPIPGVVVRNEGDGFEVTTPVKHTTTDDDGRFKFTGCLSGDNLLNLIPPEPYVRSSETATVKSEETVDLGDIEVSRGATINLLVVRGKSEIPVSGEDIELSGIDSQAGTKKKKTDKSGRATFANLPPGRYAVKGVNQHKIVSVTADETAEIKLSLGSVKVRGRITQGGEPVEARVTVRGPNMLFFEAESSAGQYSIDGMAPGTYQFYIIESPGSDIQHQESVNVPDQAEYVKNIELPESGLEVTVIDEDGTPVESVEVTVAQKASFSGFDQPWAPMSAESLFTNAEGKAIFPSKAKGTYSVSARDEEKGSAMEGAVSVPENEVVKLTLKLSKEGGTLVSVALSYTTGEGISQAWCYLHGENGQFTHNARRNAEGVMTIPDIPPGVYTTYVSYWSHSESERSVEIKANQTVEIKDVLYPAGAIHWTIMKADGSPAAGATVTVTPLETDPPENSRTGRTDSTGLFVQRGLAAGMYEMSAELGGGSSVIETISVLAGENASKTSTADR